MNLTLELSRFDNEVKEEDVGLLVWSTDPGSVEQAKTKLAKAERIHGARKAANGTYVVHTGGIPAPELGDLKYMLAYVDMGNGVYAYANKIVEYSPAQYAKLAPAYDPAFEQTAVAMLNYGAAAQMYFGHKTGELMNADLSEEQKKLNWDDSWIDLVETVPQAKAGIFTRSSIVAERGASISLDGAIALNFYVTFDTEEDVTERGVLYWDAEAYANAETLTEENALAKVVGLAKVGANQYRCGYNGIPAAEMGKTVYACVYVKTADGSTHYSGVMAMSPEYYAKILIEDQGSSDTLVEWMKRMVAYGECAKDYWTNREGETL